MPIRAASHAEAAATAFLVHYFIDINVYVVYRQDMDTALAPIAPAPVERANKTAALVAFFLAGEVIKQERSRSSVT